MDGLTPDTGLRRALSVMLCAEIHGHAEISGARIYHAYFSIAVDAMGGKYEVGQARFLLIDLSAPDLAVAMHSRGVSPARFSEHLGAYGPSPGMNRRLNFGGHYALIVEGLSIKTPWRGSGLGLVGLGMAIGELRRDCSFATLLGAPELNDLVEPGWQHSEKLRAHWRRLGFQDWGQQGSMTLDLTAMDLDLAMKRLTAS